MFSSQYPEIFVVFPHLYLRQDLFRQLGSSPDSLHQYLNTLTLGSYSKLFHWFTLSVVPLGPGLKETEMSYLFYV